MSYIYTCHTYSHAVKHTPGALLPGRCLLLRKQKQQKTLHPTTQCATYSLDVWQQLELRLRLSLALSAPRSSASFGKRASLSNLVLVLTDVVTYPVAHDHDPPPWHTAYPTSRNLPHLENTMALRFETSTFSPRLFPNLHYSIAIQSSTR